MSSIALLRAGAVEQDLLDQIEAARDTSTGAATTATDAAASAGDSKTQAGQYAGNAAASATAAADSAQAALTAKEDVEKIAEDVESIQQQVTTLGTRYRDVNIATSSRNLVPGDFGCLVVCRAPSNREFTITAFATPSENRGVWIDITADDNGMPTILAGQDVDLLTPEGSTLRDQGVIMRIVHLGSNRWIIGSGAQ
jgi:hypothetical protein